MNFTSANWKFILKFIECELLIKLKFQVCSHLFVFRFGIAQPICTYLKF